jgi:hypothetical protein
MAGLVFFRLNEVLPDVCDYKNIIGAGNERVGAHGEILPSTILSAITESIAALKLTFEPLL